jgi:hypothetical protein
MRLFSMVVCFVALIWTSAEAQPGVRKACRDFCKSAKSTLKTFSCTRRAEGTYESCNCTCHNGKGFVVKADAHKKKK